MKIHILPQSVADQIAAGEVVERPASVVKELVENAIDAEATQIDIFIEDGGKQLIEIRDNGLGMNPEDAQKCVLRHATSKIQTIDDIFSIHSLGFRGEALAAISAISHFELTTKQFDTGGTQVKVDAGKIISITSAPANKGTVIRVRDLFYPVPARLAHLKQSSTEMIAIRREVESFALSNPQVGFKLFRDGKPVLEFPVGDQFERVTQVLGEEAHTLLEVEGNFPAVKIHGWVLQPGRCGTSKKSQLLWVNGRHIEDYKLAWAVREAYHQTAGIEKHLFPKFALWIEVDPILVDVNVHPRKTEVKFSEPSDVWKAVKETVSAGLRRSEHASLSTNAVAHFSPSSFTKPAVSTTKRQHTKNFSQEHFRTPKSFHVLHSERSQTVEQPATEPVGKLKLVGQGANKYILAEAENGLWIFDQHALHERQRFEMFWKDRKKLLQEKQKLLIPHALKLDEEERICLLDHRTLLHNLGFELDGNLNVLAIPSLFTEKDLDALFAELAEWIENEQVGEHSADKLLRKLLEYKACRGAVMFGDPLQPAEMQKLLDDFESTQWRNLCPHGRPNHVFWSFEDLDREFHR